MDKEMNNNWLKRALMLMITILLCAGMAQGNIVAAHAEETEVYTFAKQQYEHVVIGYNGAILKAGAHYFFKDVNGETKRLTDFGEKLVLIEMKRDIFADYAYALVKKTDTNKKAFISADGYWYGGKESFYDEILVRGGLDSTEWVVVCNKIDDAIFEYYLLFKNGETLPLGKGNEKYVQGSFSGNISYLKYGTEGNKLIVCSRITGDYQQMVGDVAGFIWGYNPDDDRNSFFYAYNEETNVTTVYDETLKKMFCVQGIINEDDVDVNKWYRDGYVIVKYVDGRKNVVGNDGQIWGDPSRSYSNVGVLDVEKGIWYADDRYGYNDRKIMDKNGNVLMDLGNYYVNQMMFTTVGDAIFGEGIRIYILNAEDNYMNPKYLTDGSVSGVTEYSDYAIVSNAGYVTGIYDEDGNNILQESERGIYTFGYVVEFGNVICSVKDSEGKSHFVTKDGKVSSIKYDQMSYTYVLNGIVQYTLDDKIYAYDYNTHKVIMEQKAASYPFYGVNVMCNGKYLSVAQESGGNILYDADGRIIMSVNCAECIQTEDGSIFMVNMPEEGKYGVVKIGKKPIYEDSIDINSEPPENLANINDNGWNIIGGKYYWYENGVRQGMEGRGKEIYDPTSDAWYWLDAVQGGAKAVSKDVYQESFSAYPDRKDGIGKWVRYDEDGNMVKGWQTTEAGIYYFETITGAMAKGKITIDGQWYYFDEVTGLLDCESYADGWNQINGVDYWYENGVRQGYDPENPNYRGKEIYDPASNAWYWLDNVQQGAKAVSKDVYQESYSAYPDREDGTGKWVRYDSDGHMVKGWQTTEAGIYYFETITGAMAKGMVTIDGIEYYFDETTGILR